MTLSHSLSATFNLVTRDAARFRSQNVTQTHSRPAPVRSHVGEADHHQDQSRSGKNTLSGRQILFPERNQRPYTSSMWTQYTSSDVVPSWRTQLQPCPEP